MHCFGNGLQFGEEKIEKTEQCGCRKSKDEYDTGEANGLLPGWPPDMAEFFYCLGKVSGNGMDHSVLLKKALGGQGSR